MRIPPNIELAMRGSDEHNGRAHSLCTLKLLTVWTSSFLYHLPINYNPSRQSNSQKV